MTDKDKRNNLNTKFFLVMTQVNQCLHQGNVHYSFIFHRLSMTEIAILIYAPQLCIDDFCNLSLGCHIYFAVIK